MITCLALALLLLPAAVQASADGTFRLPAELEPDGFRGVKWGEDLSLVQGMKMIGRSGASNVFERADDALTMGDAKLAKIYYYSFDKKFYAAKIFLPDVAQGWDALKAAVEKEYGQGYMLSPTNILYIGSTSGLNLRRPDAPAQWSLSIFDKQLAEQADMATKKLEEQSPGK